MTTSRNRWAPLVAAGFSMIAGSALYGCSSDDTNTPKADAGTPDAGSPDGGGGGFTQPTGTAAVNFSVDDTAGKSYTAGELKWKGSFNWNKNTRVMTYAGWTGPFPLLYDDGPWSAGGHEPAGSTANDNKWGVTVFVKSSTSAAINFEYGLIRTTDENADDGDWIWTGANGTFSIPANSTAEVTATGLAIPGFGDIDMKLTVDTSTLANGFTFTAGTPLKVKGDAWGWGNEVALTQVGTTSVYEFTLGANVGPGTNAKHSGKLLSGQTAQFVFTINGVEYKVGGDASHQGVHAFTKKPTDADWVAATVNDCAGGLGGHNTCVTAP